MAMKRFEERSRELKSRVNAVFFSAKGDPRHSHRSLADMISGGDYDGDKFQMILWQELVNSCRKSRVRPHDKDAPLPPLQQRPAAQVAAKGERGGGNTCRRQAVSSSALLQCPHAALATPEPAGRHAAANVNVRPRADKQKAAGGLACQTRRRPRSRARQAAAAEKAEAEKAAAAGRSSRGKQQLLLQAAEKERTAAIVGREAQQERATQRALLSNYLMARFLGSPMVGSSATHHMIEPTSTRTRAVWHTRPAST